MNANCKELCKDNWCKQHHTVVHSCQGCDKYNPWQTIYVNIFGAPGAGKSTLAAQVFSALKSQGYTAELVTEFAKDQYWDGSFSVFDNAVEQFFIGGNQAHRLNRLDGKVQFVITDSPILLSAAYADALGQDYINLVSRIARSYSRVNVFIDREKEYNPIGRVQTADESDKLSDKIRKLLDRYDWRYLWPHNAMKDGAALICSILTKDSLLEFYRSDAEPLKEV